MQLCRVEVDGLPRWGEVEGDRAILLSAAPWHDGRPTDDVVPLRWARLLPPCEPSKIVCVGLNYRAHAAEMNKPPPAQPLLFLKPPSALLEPGGTVILPHDSARVEHEGELALVIGRKALQVRAADALDHVLGYTCLDDVTARDIQAREKRYTRAKGFDTFCPVGPWLETKVGDPHALRLELRVNGQARQRGHTGDMIFAIPELIAFISRVMTLFPGDIVTTGTPPGVGPLVPGDEVEVDIEGVGVLRHGVSASGPMPR